MMCNLGTRKTAYYGLTASRLMYAMPKWGNLCNEILIRLFIQDGTSIRKVLF